MDTPSDTAMQLLEPYACDYLFDCYSAVVVVIAVGVGADAGVASFGQTAVACCTCHLRADESSSGLMA